MMQRSLDGVRVLDLSRLLPGPAASWMLWGMGASIDRVEAPPGGDLTRHLPPRLGNTGAFFAAVGAGKRSLAVDLRSEAGRKVIARLAARYDVLMEGFKPGVIEEMGLSPDVLFAANPKLVIARLSGWGQDGPWAQRPAHDLNYVGTTGALAAGAMTSAGPSFPPVQVADMAGAFVAAMGICAALYAVARGGQGRVLDVSLAESALAVYAPHVVALATEGRAAIPAGEPLTGGFPCYRCYQCADGRWITVGAVEPKFQQAIHAATGASDVAGLTRAFATKPLDEWLEILAGACSGPVLTAQEVATHPQHAARKAAVPWGSSVWVPPPLSDARAPGKVPGLGEHSEEILEEGGFSMSEIRALLESGAVV